MAIHLQDPFENKPTDTPVTQIAQGIEKTLVQLNGFDMSKADRAMAPVYGEDQHKVVLFKASHHSFADDVFADGFDDEYRAGASYYVL